MKIQKKRLIVDRYLVEGNAGRKGASELWDAIDLQLERPVTLQVLSESDSSHSERCDAFLMHQRITSSIQCSTLLAVYDAAIWEGRAYSIMQRIGGVPASALYSPGRTPDIPLVLQVIRQVAEALQLCRNVGLAGWAFTPDAVTVDQEGNAQLAIIEGLAPPENAQDAHDVASLNGLFRTMLAGSPNAGSAALIAAQAPGPLVLLAERLEGGARSGISNAGDVAAAIASLEAASIQPTRAYEPGPVVPGVPSALADTAPAIIAPAAMEASEAPTVAAVLPASQTARGKTPENAPENAVQIPAATPVRPPVPVRVTASLQPYTPLMSGEERAAPKRKRLPWLLPVFAILLALLLGLAWLKIFNPATGAEGHTLIASRTSTPAGTAPPMASVPDLRGKSVDEAAGLAQGADLTLAQGISDYNVSYPAGQITSQQPGPGEQVRAGSPVTVTLSLGQAPVPSTATNPPPPGPTPVVKPQPAPPQPPGKKKHKGDKQDNNGDGG